MRTGGLEARLGFGLFGYLYALFCLGLLGMPTLYLLLRFRLAYWWSAALVGAFGGIVMSFVVVERLRGLPGVDALFFYSLVGVVCALTYWVLLRRRSK